MRCVVDILCVSLTGRTPQPRLWRTVCHGGQLVVRAALSTYGTYVSHMVDDGAAIRDLYEFQKRHPSMHASIERSLQNTGPIFQRYIKRALANHAAEDEAPAPPTPSTSVDARLAELKAKFRREPSREAPERMQKRMSMSTEALRTRLATMRTDDAAPSSTM